LHGLCTNQHHQNVYGFMANPSIMGAVLARETNGQNVAIIQLGSTLPSTTPPTRIAEEYAMLDCISGGRLVAGFPTGLPADATISNAVIPVEQRERFREALALVIKAWSARDVFAWNGRHYQLGMVNLLPRPIQQPHPPIWIPGAGISSTAEYVVGLDHCFCHLSYYGAKNAEAVSDRYWELAAKKGRDDKFLPLQLPAAHRRGRNRCRGRRPLRRARGVFLPQAAVYAVLLSGDPGLPRLPRDGAGAAAQSARRHQSARAQGQGLLRPRLRHRRQPKNRA